jgi:two-component system, response regulator
MLEQMARQRFEILLVEDDLNEVAVAMRAFRRHGLAENVLVVGDGAEAHEYLLGPDTAVNGARRLVPRVIFLDLKIPKIGGLELLQQLRANERTRDVPIVIVTSSDREPDVKEAYRRGANSFVVKQFDHARPGEYLVDIAHYWLDLNRATR